MRFSILRRSASASGTLGVEMARFERTDLEWSVIQPLLPKRPRGVPRADDRQMMNGLFRRLQKGVRGGHTGALWSTHNLRQIQHRESQMTNDLALGAFKREWKRAKTATTLLPTI